MISIIMVIQKAMVSSKSNEWSTPHILFDRLNYEFNFTLDPCCTKNNSKCKKYYTIKENGLKQDWNNEIVFMNPPYGGNTAEWIKKAYIESLNGVIVVCLITSSTDRSYWHDIIFPFASEIRFVKGRVKFGGNESSAPFASAIVVFDKNKENNLISSINPNNDKYKRKNLDGLKEQTKLIEILK